MGATVKRRVCKVKQGARLRTIALAISFVLCASMVPSFAFAQDASQEQGQDFTQGVAASTGNAGSINETEAAAGAGNAGAGVGGGTTDVAPAGDALVGSNSAAAGSAAGNGAATTPDTETVGASAGSTTDASSAAGGGTDSADGEQTNTTPVVPGSDAARDAASQDSAANNAESDARLGLLAQQRDQSIALVSANYDYSGTAHCWFRNDSVTDNVFDVEIDGVTYTAYCLDEGLPAPANGWYTFYATWDDNEKAYEIVLDTANAEVHWSQTDTGHGCQRVGGFRIYAKGNFTLTKSSTSVEVQGIYNVAGAVYGLYWYYADAQALSEPNYRLVIGENGSSGMLTGLTPDERWYVRELEAPAGFALDPQIYTVSIRPNQNNSYHVTDTPLMDTQGVVLAKKTAEGQEHLDDHLSLALAEYQFDYYAGYYETSAQAQASGSPTRSWVFRTNEAGYTGLQYADSSFTHDGVSYPYLVSGTVYRTEAGEPAMPMGTLVIHETKAPYGYLLSSDVFLAQLVYDAQTQSLKWVSEDAIAAQSSFHHAIEFVSYENVKLFGISVYKEIQGAQDSLSPEGIQFHIVYQPTGEIVTTLTLDAEGKATTGERFLPCGIYEVREVEESLPVGVLPYRLTSGTGSNVVAVVEAPDNGSFPLYQVVQVTCVDYSSDTPCGEKKDHDTGLPIANTEFTLYRYTGELVINDGSFDVTVSDFDPWQSYWERVETAITDAHGKFSFSAQPYGVYMLVETRPDWRYLSASEGACNGTAADPRATARVFLIDKNHPCETQLWEDTAIQLECDVDKATIAVTSAGLASKRSSDAPTTISNVGVETYRYDVHFSNKNTNTYADEFWVEDLLNMVSAPFDLRLVTIVLPSVKNDSLPGVAFLVKTNKSAHELWIPAVEASCHSSTLCDGSSRFAGAGWRLVGFFSSDTPTTLLVDSLGLGADEYITGLCLYYGAVEKGFSSITPLSYLVCATHELAEGIIIPNTATSHISRNWAQRDGSTNGLSDDAVDRVTTTTLGTFEQHFYRDYLYTEGITFGSWSTTLPQTGDTTQSVVVMALIAAFAGAVVFVFVGFGRRGAHGMKRLAFGILALGVSMGTLIGASHGSSAYALDASHNASAETQTRTVTWLSTDEQPDFAEVLNWEGQRYTLTNTDISEVDSQIASVTAQRYATVGCAPEDLQTTQNSFPQALDVQNDTYQGSIPLTSVSAEPVYAQRSWEVNEQRAFAGLPNNDAAQIPTTLIFNNTETGNTLSLRLASLAWEVDAFDSYGLPALYTAQALYRGTETATVIDYYNVTAWYEGSVQAKTPVVTYQATLTYQAPLAEVAEVAEPEPSAPSEGVPVQFFAALAAAALAACAIGVFFWYRHRDVRVCRVELAESAAQTIHENQPEQGTHRKETLKVVARITSKRGKDGSLVVEFPARFDATQHRYALVLAPHRANACLLQVMQGGQVLTSTCATRVVYL